MSYYLEEREGKLKSLIRKKKVLYLKVKAAIRLLENFIDLIEKEGVEFADEVENAWRRLYNLMKQEGVIYGEPSTYIDILREIKTVKRDIEELKKSGGDKYEQGTGD